MVTMPYINGEYREPNNGDRAAWANAALNAYAAETRPNSHWQTVDVANPDDPEDRENAEEVIGDLLCDLQHLTDQWGIDWEEMLRRGAMHHRDEVAEARRQQ